MRRYLLTFLLALAMIAATRLPFMPGQLFSFDEVNMVYAMDKIDTRLSQPQPPGYPLFILEMRAMKMLRVVRPESNLIALSLLGSAAAMTALVWCGEVMFGGWTGYCAAILLWLYPSFWYAGLNSALRVHLALISAGVAGACWRAWRGDRHWAIYSALAVGLGAGIRPEVGPLLVPMWAASLRHPNFRWKDRTVAGLALISAVLCWLLPLTATSGGLLPYFRHSMGYLATQSAVTSPIFGLEATRWLTNSILLAVWTFSGLVFAPVLWVLTRGTGEGIDRTQRMFFALWLAPSFLFALFIHVGDAGHTLAMIVPVCLYLGYWVSRAASFSDKWMAPDWRLTLPVALAAAIPGGGPERLRLILPGVTLAAAATARFGSGGRGGGISPRTAAGLMLGPWLLFFSHVFLAGGWEYATRPEISAERLWLDVKLGFHLSSYQHVRQVVDPDDAAIRATRELTREAGQRTVIVSERGLTSWRKMSYYLPQTPILVLEQTGVNPTRLLATKWLREVQKEQHGGPGPLQVTVPAGWRVVWMLKPGTEFETELRQRMPLTNLGPVAYTDLPGEPGSRRIGGFLISWEKTPRQ